VCAPQTARQPRASRPLWHSVAQQFPEHFHRITVHVDVNNLWARIPSDVAAIWLVISAMQSAGIIDYLPFTSCVSDLLLHFDNFQASVRDPDAQLQIVGVVDGQEDAIVEVIVVDAQPDVGCARRQCQHVAPAQGVAVQLKVPQLLHVGMGAHQNLVAVEFQHSGKRHRPEGGKVDDQDT
jgi:hypothetical protein